jgi:hypothetical protein
MNDRFGRMTASSAEPPFGHRAAKVRFPPIVSNAALFTKVAFGLEAGIRCGIHQ